MRLSHDGNKNDDDECDDREGVDGKPPIDEKPLIRKEQTCDSTLSGSTLTCDNNRSSSLSLSSLALRMADSCALPKKSSSSRAPADVHACATDALEDETKVAAVVTQIRECVFRLANREFDSLVFWFVGVGRRLDCQSRQGNEERKKIALRDTAALCRPIVAFSRRIQSRSPVPRSSICS